MKSLVPEVAVNARRRIATNRWSNVEVVEAISRIFHSRGTFDGLLMFAAADVYASEEALENIFPHLRENARVVAFGYKYSNNALGKILNPLLRMAPRLLSFPTTPLPEYQPWQILAKRLEKLEVEEYFLGTMFLASGSIVTK